MYYSTANNTNHTRNRLYNYYIFRVRAYIHNGWANAITDPVLKLVAS